ncbi:hypothetical protein QWI49_12210 [Acinetobacter nosocomialis]|uniref:hypothetical protein n=1 Tax=Acinetobacter nosocomialis TaxID=106654 RepID=UPI0027424508|nr:hypothetical protein [Acinetobacter nosocomialis]MDP7775911.1 hypothetical protein [Acinetobacter nosocomialis]
MAFGPIDYTMDVANPFQAATQGFNSGLQTLNNINAVKANQLEEERKKQAFLQQQVRNEDLYKFSLIPNKTADDYSSIISRYPDLAEPYQKAWGILDAGQQQQTLNTASQVYAALRSQQPQIAKDILNEQIQAYDNSGKKSESNQLKMVLGLIDKSPEAAASSVGMLMSSVSPDKFKDILSTLGGEQRANEMQPYQIGQISANTAKTVAETNDIPLAAEDRRTGVENQGKNIEYNNQYNYDKLGQDWKIELAKMSQQEQIEAARLRAAKNETSVQRMERLEKAQSFSNAASTAASTAKLAADLIADYKKLSDASGAGVWNAAWRNVPGSAEYDFSRRVDTLKSQAFLIGAQSLKGLGAMTEMEGKKVTDALGNLDLSQNTGQVVQQLAAIAKAANSVAQHSNRNAQNYATKGYGYSKEVVDTAKARGVSPAEMQKIANELGIH